MSFQVTADRAAVLRRYEVLEAPKDGSMDDIAFIAAKALGTPIGTVSIVDVDRVWLAATYGLDGVSEVGVEPGLCVSAVMADGFYLVRDAGTDPRTLDHPLVRGELGLRFYAAAPIITADGERLGTVNVIDVKPRDVTDDERAILMRLASMVGHYLDQRLAAIRAVRFQQQLRREAEARADAALISVNELGNGHEKVN